MTTTNRGDETVDAETRTQVLQDAEYRCEFCGRTAVARGGSVRLEIHHIDRDPDEIDEHDPRNLSALCRHCHAWQHQQPEPDEAAVELTDADLQQLRPKDIEILDILAEHGPLTTGEVVEAHTADLTVVTARERLWVLMGLDNQVASRDEQLVDQDATTGEWGLAEQITHSERGRIPDDARTLLQRAADERVRQALAHGCDRDVVADLMDVHPRTTWNKQKRARAYDFPLNAIDGRTGGRPPVDDTGADTQRRGDSGTADEGTSAKHDQEQPVATDGDQPVEGGDTQSEESIASRASEADSVQDGGQEAEVDSAEVSASIRQAIAALETLETHL